MTIEIYVLFNEIVSVVSEKNEPQFFNSEYMIYPEKILFKSRVNCFFC